MFRFSPTIFLIGLLVVFGFFAFQEVKAACTNVPLSGNYTITTSCTFDGTVNGVEKGNLTIPSGKTLTIGAGQTIVWNPGYSVFIQGSIAINQSGGQLRKTYLWLIDTDNDTYPATGQVAANTAPSGGKRRSDPTFTTTRGWTYLGEIQYDYDNTSPTVYPGTNCGPEKVCGYNADDGTCQPKPAGEQGLPVCQRCDGTSLYPVYIAANTQDTEGTNTSGACYSCDGSGNNVARTVDGAAATALGCTAGEEACRRCDAGNCTYYTSDQHGCSTGYVCSASGTCTLFCYANGSSCSVAEDCCSGNCQNGVCCAAGQTCCSSDSHCPADTCLSTCQKRDYYCDATTDHYCKYTDSNIPSGYVCTGSGVQTPVSSSNYCNVDNVCTAGACSGTKYYTSCNGLGSCRAATDHTDSASSTVYASTGYTLTADCGTTGTTLCGYSSYNGCSGACQKKRDQLRCDASHNCAYDVGDDLAYMSTAGKVCSGGSEVSPSASVYCDTTINCVTNACSASRYYRGCTVGATTCTDTGRVSYTAWNTTDNYAISETTYKVGTSCAQSYSACGGTCTKCSGGSCVNQSSAEDLYNQCTASSCPVVLNSASGQSCNTVCAGYTKNSGLCSGTGASCAASQACSCASIGTDTGGTNGKYQLTGCFKGCACGEDTADCTSQMINDGGGTSYCSISTYWTYCRCQ